MRQAALETLPLVFSREHEVITRLIVSLARGTGSKYFPGRPLYHQLGLSMLLLLVIIGHIERSPMTVSKLARTFGSSRTTTLRWLSELIKEGYIERVGNDYWVTKNETNSPSVRNAIAKNAGLIIAATDELRKVSKMDK